MPSSENSTTRLIRAYGFEPLLLPLLSSPLLTSPLPALCSLLPLPPSHPHTLPHSLSVCGFVLNREESDRNLSSSGFLSSLLLYLPFSSGYDQELSGLAAFLSPLSTFRIPVAPRLTRGPKGGQCDRLYSSVITHRPVPPCIR